MRRNSSTVWRTSNLSRRSKSQQRNWIGRSEGAEVNFTVPAAKAFGDGILTVYTTRPDTLFGATYMVVSPEHPMIEKLKDQIENYDEVLCI